MGHLANNRVAVVASEGFLVVTVVGSVGLAALEACDLMSRHMVARYGATVQASTFSDEQIFFYPILGV